MPLSENFKGQKKDGIITTGRKKAAQSIRTTSRKNEGGTESTHVMEWGSTGGKGKTKYTANPTIFPEKDGSWKDLGESEDRSAASKEAQKRGEVFGFRSAKRAEKFAAGSWKKGQARKDSMKNYREAKKAGELYTQSKDFKAEKKSVRKSNKG